MKNYILFLYFSQIRQSVINKPKNIAALDTLNEPTILNGNNAITIGKVLNTHAQRGSPVAPETTATNNATEKANTPKKQIAIVHDVFLKNSRMISRASSVHPIRM